MDLNLYEKDAEPKTLGIFAYLNAERIDPRMSHRAGGSGKRIRQDGSNAIYLMERADNLGT